MATRACASCGNALKPGVRHCTSCGTPAPPEPVARFCTGCGGQLKPHAQFCTSCGAQAVAPSAPAAHPRPAPQPRAPQAVAPRHGPIPSGAIGQLTGAGWVHGLMPTLARRSPAWIMLLLAAIVGHFYLMAGPNGGISPSNDSVDWLLNTKNPREYRFNFPTSVNGSGDVPPIQRRLLASFTNGNIASAAVIWGSASVALFSFIGVGSPPGRSGPGAFFRRPFQWLGWITRCRGRDWGALLLGAGLAMAGANIAGLNPQASLIAGATGALGVTGGWGRWTSGAIYRLVPLWKGERSRTRFSMRAAHLVVAGAPIGVTASSVIEGAGWGVLIAIVGAAIFVSAFVRRSIGAMSSPAALGMLAFGVAGLITKDLAMADDGGKSEFSGGWEEFLQSQGAIEIGIHSATGTASTILGPLTPRGGEQPLPEEGGANNRVTAVSLSIARRET